MPLRLLVSNPPPRTRSRRRAIRRRARAIRRAGKKRRRKAAAVAPVTRTRRRRRTRAASQGTPIMARRRRRNPFSAIRSVARRRRRRSGGGGSRGFLGRGGKFFPAGIIGTAAAGTAGFVATSMLVDKVPVDALRVGNGRIAGKALVVAGLYMLAKRVLPRHAAALAAGGAIQIGLDIYGQIRARAGGGTGPVAGLGQPDTAYPALGSMGARNLVDPQTGQVFQVSDL